MGLEYNRLRGKKGRFLEIAFPLLKEGPKGYAFDFLPEGHHVHLNAEG